MTPDTAHWLTAVVVAVAAGTAGAVNLVAGDDELDRVVAVLWFIFAALVAIWWRLA